MIGPAAAGRSARSANQRQLSEHSVAVTAQASTLARPDTMTRAGKALSMPDRNTAAIAAPLFGAVVVCGSSATVLRRDQPIQVL